MCTSGFSDEELSLDNAKAKKTADNFARIETVMGGNPYCGGRYGNSQYLKNTHNSKKIKIEVETIFDNGTPKYNDYTLRARTRLHIGCTQWRGDGVPIQYYVRKITSAEFI